MIMEDKTTTKKEISVFNSARFWEVHSQPVKTIHEELILFIRKRNKSELQDWFQYFESMAVMFTKMYMRDDKHEDKVVFDFLQGMINTIVSAIQYQDNLKINKDNKKL